MQAAQRFALAVWRENQPTKRKKAFAWTPPFLHGPPPSPLHAVLARFRVVRLVMQNQKTSLINIFAIKFYPSRLSRKNLIALFMKEQPI
jgi:hypothetical protein